MFLPLLQSERLKLFGVLTVLSEIGLKISIVQKHVLEGSNLVSISSSFSILTYTKLALAFKKQLL